MFCLVIVSLSNLKTSSETCDTSGAVCECIHRGLCPTLAVGKFVCAAAGKERDPPSQRCFWREPSHPYSPSSSSSSSLLYRLTLFFPFTPSPLSFPSIASYYTWKRGIFGGIKRSIVLHLPRLGELRVAGGVVEGGMERGAREGGRLNTMYFTWKE